MTNAPLKDFLSLFHEEGEAFPEVILTPQGVQKGVKWDSLPDIWREMAKWVNMYFICDGQPSVLGGDALKILIHLKKGCVNPTLRVNLPEYLADVVIKVGQKYKSGGGKVVLKHPGLIHLLCSHQVFFKPKWRLERITVGEGSKPKQLKSGPSSTPRSIPAPASHPAHKKKEELGTPEHVDKSGAQVSPSSTTSSSRVGNEGDNEVVPTDKSPDTIFTTAHPFPQYSAMPTSSEVHSAAPETTSVPEAQNPVPTPIAMDIDHLGSCQATNPHNYLEEITLLKAQLKGGKDIITVLPLMKKLTFQVACDLFFSLSDSAKRETLANEFNTVVKGIWSVPLDLPGTAFRKDENDKPRIEEEILDIVVVVMIAGHDTTYNLLTHLVRGLALNPNIYQNIQDILFSMFPIGFMELMISMIEVVDGLISARSLFPEPWIQISLPHHFIARDMGQGSETVVPMISTQFRNSSTAAKEMTVRDALNSAIEEEMSADPKVFLMGEEVGEYQGAYKVSKGLLQKFGPDRVIDTPITEAGFTGIGVGAAYYGLKPIVEFMTFNFAMQRAFLRAKGSEKLSALADQNECRPLNTRSPHNPPKAVS
ncbi:hypothetical protein KI387_025057 [Taxus chinensis]|uniref:Transketolase-like pyrimidine-binding domain-containing protein n=1 Tax=Taxus chinensis TaxID=29808 RepID=A0AA38LC97_TAXCH|nr:hypothetical protein KI387_025057 [Taxus chinensis]